jgi:tetratricopeptide (TPR) repeat protein
VHNEGGNRKSKAHTLDSLGYIHQQLGELHRAAEYYRDALILFREVGDRYGEADALINLGDAARDTGDGSAAREAWLNAAAILDDMDHPRADQVRERLATAAI